MFLAAEMSQAKENATSVAGSSLAFPDKDSLLSIDMLEEEEFDDGTMSTNKKLQLQDLLLGNSTGGKPTGATGWSTDLPKIKDVLGLPSLTPDPSGAWAPNPWPR